MVENQTAHLSFSNFLSEFNKCIKFQEFKFVNNKPLSLLLLDNPEKFFDYLMKILSDEDHTYNNKRQAILIVKNLIQNTDRLQSLSIPFKMKLFSFLFDFLSTILEKCDMFAILNEITEILSQIFLKFPAEKDFFPSILLNNLNDFKNMSKGHLYNFILFFLSKIIFVNSDNSYSELIEINDFLYLSIENEDDAILMASYLNINIKIYQNESYQEHHSQILANIVAIFERIMDHNIFKHCLPIHEEFFGFLINFMSEIPNLKFPNSALIPKILNHQAHSNLEIRKILTIFLSNCTNSSNCFNLNDDLTSQIFSVFLYILVDGIMDPNEQWLQDTSFDKMSSEQNIICDYETLAHFHYVSMILYTNVSEDRSITYLKKYSTTTDWKLMCALLIALTNLVSFTDLQTFSPVFPYIFSVATNENPKVRLSLLSLVEELSIDYGQAFYKKTRKLYEKKILAFLEDPVPRIKIMSTFTIISYLNEIPKKESKRKLLYLIPKIKKCIEDKVYYFIPEILSLASEFVHHLDTEAQEFAPELIPLTFGLKFEGLSPADEINFNGKIMEFISIFIQAINEPNLINPYKEQILNMLLVNQGKIKNEITLNEIYILDAWQRMALIYKKDIQNYLGVVIGKMIPLGIKYMKDKHELQAINEAFKGSFPRIYHTEVNRDQEIIKNLGEILKIYLEYSEHEAIKNYETIILFLTTSYQTIISGLIHKKDKVQAIEEISEDEDNIFYQDFHYFYKDLISCSFLFLQHYSKIASKDIFLSGYRRVTNALWQIAEKNQMNEKPLIKLQYKVFESLRYSILELEKDSFTNNDLTQITTRIRAEWQRILTIDFEDFSNEEDENEDEDLNEEESFEDFRIDIYFVIHELISNLLKILSDDQKEVIIQEIFPELYLCYLDDYFPKEELNEVEEDILSSIMFSLVEILQDVTAEFIHENLPWKKILESLIKYTLNPDYLIRHNSCYALGFFHEKVENHHDLFPEILNYVTKSIENLEKASHLKEENIEISDYEINNDHENNINNDSIENNNNNENDNIIINNENNDIENNSENNIEVSSAEETNTDYLECLDNVYSGIGRMIKVYFGNNEYIKPEFIHLYLKYLPIKYDQEEGRDQHEMILGVLIKFWVEIIQMKEENYLEILRIISELCLEINKDLADIKVMKKIKKLAKVMKNSNLERFTVNIDKLSSDLKTALEICLNNKEFDED